jgi:hypothetical protein
MFRSLGLLWNSDKKLMIRSVQKWKRMQKKKQLLWSCVHMSLTDWINMEKHSPQSTQTILDFRVPNTIVRYNLLKPNYLKNNLIWFSTLFFKHESPQYSTQTRTMIFSTKNTVLSWEFTFLSKIFHHFFTVFSQKVHFWKNSIFFMNKFQNKLKFWIIFNLIYFKLVVNK